MGGAVFVLKGMFSRVRRYPDITVVVAPTMQPSGHVLNWVHVASLSDMQRKDCSPPLIRADIVVLSSAILRLSIASLPIDGCFFFIWVVVCELVIKNCLRT